MQIEVYRSEYLESSHEVFWQVTDLQGQTIAAHAPSELNIFPRSAIKMIQILPLIRWKIQQGHKLNPLEVSCGCASHVGQRIHTQVVAAWLARMGCSEKNLVCGAHPPFNDESYEQLILSQQKPSKLHNNCSGKHASQLELAQALQAPMENYFQPDHPVQQALRQEIENKSEHQLCHWGVDGCGIPAWQMPLSAFAKAMSSFAGLATNKNTAESLVYKYVVENPEYNSGTDEFCTRLMQSGQGRWLVKVGAEGMMTAVAPQLNRVFVLKAKDGSERAAQIGIASLMHRFLPAPEQELLKPWTEKTLNNWSGTQVGMIKARF
ncbi:MAG: asparaginase [Pseudobdellovibrionaceae bacterium]